MRLWDVATGQYLRSFAGHDNQIRSVAFSPDGKVLASAGEDCVVKLWEIATGNLLQMLKDPDGAIATAVFSPDGKLLASGGMAGTVRLWNPQTGQELRQWRAHPLSTNSLAFSADGKVLASTSDLDSAIRRWDTATGKEIDPVPAHTGSIKSVQFSGDGKTLFSCAQDRKVVEWDLAAGRVRKESSFEPLGMAKAIWYPEIMAISPTGKTLAMVGTIQNPVIPFDTVFDHAIRLWDNALGKEIRALSGHTAHVWSVCFSPDEKFLASAGPDGIRLWELRTGKELRHLQELARDNSTLVFSPDVALLAYVGADNTIRLWDIGLAKELRRWKGGLLNTRTLAFSRDGKLLASGGTKGLCVWTVATGKRLLMHELGSLPAGSLVFSPSGRVLAAAGYYDQFLKKGYACTIELLEVPSAQEIRHFEVVQITHAPPLDFAPNGRTLAFGCADSTILLWDATGLAKDGKLKPAVVRSEDLTRLWSDLAGAAPQADLAVWTLALAPAQSLPFLKAEMEPRPPAPADQVAKLIAGLESERFAVRQKAAQALDALGEAAEPALRKTLEGKMTLDLRQRVELILQKRDKAVLRNLRAIETLEQIGTPEARQVLGAMSRRAPNPRVAAAASAALQRLATQPQ